MEVFVIWLIMYYLMGLCWKTRRRNHRLKHLTVNDLQASQVFARIEQELILILNSNVYQKSESGFCRAKPAHKYCIEYNLNVDLHRAVKKVSMSEQLDRNSPENSKHEVDRKTLDDEREDKSQVREVKVSHNAPWRENWPDSVNDMIIHYKLKNETGQIDIIQRALDNISYLAYPFSPENRDVSAVVYPVYLSVHSLMRYEILRLRSYNQISTGPRHSVAQLAQNGFYLSGQDGEVTCFNCEVNHKQFLSGIHLDDTAHEENCGRERASKNLGVFMGTRGLTSADLKLFDTVYRGDSDKLFIQQMSSEESQAFYLYTSADTNPVKTQIDPNFWRVLNEEGNFNHYDSDDDFLDLRAAAYPHFANRRTRKETFISWDPTHSQKPDDLVNLGFFYAGYSDCARCFYCGLGLKYWRPNDDAAYQHARFRSQCKYNQFVKGQEYIDYVQRTVASENQGANADADTVEVPNLDQLMKLDAVKQVLEEGWSWQDVRAGVAQLVQDLGEECLVYDILIEILNLKAVVSSGVHNAAITNEEDVHDGELINVVNAMETDEMAESSQVDAAKANTSSSIKSATESATNLDPDVVLRLIEREHNYLQKRLHCRVCGKNKIGCIYLPCGHVVACQKCGDLASTCILCQKVISAMASTYLS